MKVQINETTKTLNEEYEQVNSNPIRKGIIQAIITLIDLLIMFVIIWHVFTYVIPQGSWLNIVDGNSMEPTMHNAQIIFTDMTTITRGDIVTAYMPNSVVEQYPEKEGVLLIKRVIGVPGDEIEITREGIYINGTLLTEDYIPEEFNSFTYKEGGQNKLTLASDEYFLVGDNREVSYDSRTFGPVKTTDILYKQSASPTTNFWLKTALVVVILIFDIFLYMLIEFILMEAVYGIMNKGKNKNNDMNDSKKQVVHTTTETVTLKGDKK